MKGIILAGGLGSRLYPLTYATNKHLLPIYDKPMVFYPIKTLVDAGIDEIMIVVGGPHAGHFMSVLKNGVELGIKHLEFAFQDTVDHNGKKIEGGISHALSLCENFADNSSVAVILGDNTTDFDISGAVKNFTDGATIFLKEVQDPNRYGVPVFNEEKKITSIEEKPEHPKSNYAVTGLYLYDNTVFSRIKTLKPSARGELEITDLNNSYINDGKLTWSELAGFWTDAGTYDSLFVANEYWAKKVTNKILVTGGCGFIGSNFVRYWRKKYPKDEIVVLDKLTYAGHENNLSGIEHTFIQGDICDISVVEKAMQGVDIVVHFAAETHVDRSVMDPGIFNRTNVIGTQVLLDAALKQRVRLFHHVSTDEVFGSLPIDKPEMKFSEETPYSPSSPYSASKASSDHLVRAYHKTFGLPITITNTSNNYGPYQDPEKLIPRFITNLIEGKKVPLMGNGENVRDWCYVEDHCRAIDIIIQSALKNGEVIGETFCVGGNSEKSNLEITRELLKIFEKDDSWIEKIPHRLGHDARYAIDSSKIDRILGWRPENRIEDRLAETAQWYKDNEWWWKPLKVGRPSIDPDVQLKRANELKSA